MVMRKWRQWQNGYSVFVLSLMVWVVSPHASTRPEISFALSDWKSAVKSRLEIESAWPGTEKLFRGKEPGDRSALRDALDTDKLTGIQGGWVALAKALAVPSKSETTDVEKWFAVVESAGKGHPGFYFEVVLTLMRAGQAQRAHGWITILERELLIEGFIRAPGFAKIALLHAREVLRMGNTLQANQAIDFAEVLDPLSPWNPLTRLEVALRASAPWSWNTEIIWKSVFDFITLLKYYQNGLPLLFNLLHWLRLSLEGVGLFLLAGFILRYFTRVTHLLAERLPRVVEMPWRYLAIALAGLSLWVAGVGVLYLAAPLVLVLWNSARPSERGHFRMIFLGLLSLPILLTIEHALLRHLDPHEGLHYYHIAYETGYDPGLVRQIESFEPKTKEDQVYQALALALQYRKLGNTVKATEVLKRVETIHPNHPFLLLYRGNIAMMQENYPEAEKQYVDVLRLTPTWVESWFNASQAALFQNRSDAHKQRLDRAADADANFLTLYLKQNDETFQSTPPYRRAMDPMPRFEMALLPSIDQFISMRFLREEMASGLLTVPSWALLALTLVCMVAIALRQKSTPFMQGKTTFTCKICGRVTCRHCRKGVHCEPCFKSVVSVADLRLREELVQRMRQRSEQVRHSVFRALNTIMPGLGDIYVGAGGMPLIWLTLAVLSWALMIQVGHPLMDYPVQALGLFSHLPWLPLVIVYVSYNAFTYLPGGQRLVAGSQMEVEL